MNPGKDENKGASNKVTLSVVLSIISLLLSICTASYVIYFTHTEKNLVADGSVENVETVGDEKTEEKEFNINECVELDTDALVNTFDENEIKATADYCNKPIYVKGVVVGLSNNRVKIALDTAVKGYEEDAQRAYDEYEDVDMKYLDYYKIQGEPNDEIKESLMNFKVGDEITLYGELTNIYGMEATMDIHAVK